MAKLSPSNAAADPETKTSLNVANKIRLRKYATINKHKCINQRWAADECEDSRGGAQKHRPKMFARLPRLDAEVRA